MAIQAIGNSGAATVGSLDPDNTAALTVKMGTGNKADKLIERHAANWPDSLVTALSLPTDGLRSDALDLEEVHDALTALSGREAFFKDDYSLEGATVRGRNQRERIVSVVYELPSGRVGQGVIPYVGLTKSEENFEKLRVAVIDGSIILDRDGHVAEDRRSEETAADETTASTEEIAAAEKRAADAESEKREALATLKSLQERLEKLEDPEPVDGWDDLKAAEKVKLVEEGGVSEFGLAGLEKLQKYESEHTKHKTVLDAIEEVVRDHQAGAANGASS